MPETTRVRSDGQEVRVRTRPTPQLIERICDALANGKSLNAICEQKDMPARSAVYKWIRRKNPDGTPRYPGLGATIEEARRQGAEAMVDEVLDISDNTGTKNVGRDRLRIDTRFKVAGKLDPDRWGERTQIQHDVHHSGEVGVYDVRETARTILALLNQGASREELGLPEIDVEAEDAVEVADG